jgi:hypothetical protein
LGFWLLPERRSTWITAPAKFRRRPLPTSSFRQRIYDQGAEPISGSSEELKISIAPEYHRWSKLNRTVGLKAE